MLPDRPGFDRILTGLSGSIFRVLKSTADTWLRMQGNYDLAQARRHASEIVIERLTPRVA
jgi:plasmid maintenance system antidote protein VapI